MSSSTQRLAVQTRADVGSTSTRALRRKGRVPAVLFGHGSAPVAVEIDGKAFEEVVRRAGTHGLLSLAVDGKGSETALVRELQRDPITHRVIHADLQRVSAGEKISAKLHVVTIGVANGVRNFGGVMDVITHEVEISGPASELPAHLEVDVTNLEVRAHVSAREIPLPRGFTLVTPPETVIIAIEPPRTVSEEAASAAATPTSEAPTETAAASGSAAPSQ